jgi:hypothetical protein
LNHEITEYVSTDNIKEEYDDEDQKQWGLLMVDY